MSKMNPEVKAKWLAALRSGEYEQGTGQLKSDCGDKYCCLGVATDLYMKEIGEGEWDMYHGMMKFKINGDGESGTLHKVVQNWAGIATPNPEVRVADEAICIEAYSSLAELNDSGYSFAQIADIIEAQL